MANPQLGMRSLAFDPNNSGLRIAHAAITMGNLPRDSWPDSTLAMGLDPYGYISNQCRRLGTNVFATRLLMQPAICMVGRRAAELFYDPERFQRSGAAPLRLQFSLFGRGGVQTLDGPAHRHRK